MEMGDVEWEEGTGFEKGIREVINEFVKIKVIVKVKNLKFRVLKSLLKYF